MSTPENEQGAAGDIPDREADRVVVVTQDGMGVAGPGTAEGSGNRPTELVEQPAKVMRVASMIKQLLEEVRGAPLDEAGRQRLAEIHRRSITELEQGLSQELVDELERITLPFGEATPSEPELRIAQAQLQQMRRALPGGHPGGTPGQPMPGQAMPGSRNPSGPDDERTGQYL